MILGAEHEFLVAVGILHLKLEHEAVLLRLRQRIGAFEFNGILGGKDGEAVRQRMRFVVDGDLTFLHGLF